MATSSMNYDDMLAITRENGGKLDTLIAGQVNLCTRIQSLEEEVSQLNRTVHGHNGNPGLVTKVALIQESLKSSPNVDKGSETKRFISWEWLVDKALMPVIIAFLLWFLLTVLPNLLGHVGSGGG